MRHIFEMIEDYEMIEPGMRVIAGVSGGADSVCLLYVLNEYRKTVPFELMAVHVEHGLRGQESLEDAEFTRELCRRLGVPCRVEHVDVRTAARAQGLSEEEAARKLRYEAFWRVGADWRADRLAVAHNRGDQAETVLWNLARGSGLRGLCGMWPVREVGLAGMDGAGTVFGERMEDLRQEDAGVRAVIRPLLHTDREEIEGILREAGLPWRTDRTNLGSDYTRNRIRLSLLPQMESSLNAQAGLHIARAARKLQELEEYLERQADAAARRCFVGTGTDGERMNGCGMSGMAGCHVPQKGSMAVLWLAPFFEEEPPIQEELLKRALVMCGCGLKNVGEIHLKMLMELAGKGCGRECHLPGGVRAVREDGILRFVGHDRVPRDGMDGSAAGEPRKMADGHGDMAQYDLPIPGTLVVGTDGREGASSRASILSSAPSGDAPEGQPSPCRLRVTVGLLANSPAVQNEIRDEKKYTKLLSYDTIKNNVRLRRRRPGDYLVLNDQGGHRKLKDYLIDMKIPRDRRDALWLVADGPHILWVVGYRISAAAKVREDTEKVIRIQIEEEQT